MWGGKKRQEFKVRTKLLLILGGFQMVVKRVAMATVSSLLINL